MLVTDDFGGSLQVFYSVGALRELLKEYPDNMSLFVCDVPGILSLTEEQYLLIEPLGVEEYEVPERFIHPINYQEYMDF